MDRTEFLKDLVQRAEPVELYSDYAHGGEFSVGRLRRVTNDIYFLHTISPGGVPGPLEIGRTADILRIGIETPYLAPLRDPALTGDIAPVDVSEYDNCSSLGDVIEVLHGQNTLFALDTEENRYNICRVAEILDDALVVEELLGDLTSEGRYLITFEQVCCIQIGGRFLEYLNVKSV